MMTLLKVFLLFLASVLLVILQVVKIDRSIPGVALIKIRGGCQVELYDKTTQPAFTMAYSCPGEDTIRLWPLPILQPFYEDWQDWQAPGQKSIGRLNGRPKTGIKLDDFTGYFIPLCQERGLVGLSRGSFIGAL